MKFILRDFQELLKDSERFPEEIQEGFPDETGEHFQVRGAFLKKAPGNFTEETPTRYPLPSMNSWRNPRKESLGETPVGNTG